MNIERLDILAFRSLYQVAVSPKHFTVLVGPNNAGKSNLADALDFLGDVHRHGLELAVSRNGGFENIAHRRMRRTKQSIRFSVTMRARYREIHILESSLRRERRTRPELRGWNPTILFRHTFAIKAATEAIRADFFIEEESIELRAVDDSDDFRLAGLQRTGSSIGFMDASPQLRNDALWRPAVRGLSPTPEKARRVSALEVTAESLTETIEETELIGSQPFLNPVVRFFSRALSNIRIFQLSPIECRQSGVPSPNAEMERHGGNLPALVDYMQRAHESAWQLTLDAMREIVPGLEEIRTGYSPDRRLTLQFVEEGVGRPWNSEEVSDGTIQSLALFSAVFDPRSPLTLVEEPENSVHPWIVRSFVRACEGVKSKQLIVTTHSPALLAYVRPEDVSIAWRRGGRTAIKPLTELDPDSARMWHDGSLDVFELLDSGQVREAVPESYG